MAMKPRCIVLDEPTAMLDPNGRREVIRAVRDLNRQEGVTVILITHYMEEVIDADRLFVMDEGKIVMSGAPREVFSDVDRLKALRLGRTAGDASRARADRAGDGSGSRHPLDELVGGDSSRAICAAGEAAVEPAAGKPDPEDSGERNPPGENGRRVHVPTGMMHEIRMKNSVQL
jgi:ABC-type multidrug transport system ATPase subunit